MSEGYIRQLEDENDRLRSRIVISEEEVERANGILDEIRIHIKKNPSLTISTDFKSLNEDVSGKLFMVGKKKFDKFIIQFDNIEDWYQQMLEILEDQDYG